MTFSLDTILSGSGGAAIASAGWWLRLWYRNRQWRKVVKEAHLKRAHAEQAARKLADDLAQIRRDLSLAKVARRAGNLNDAELDEQVDRILRRMGYQEGGA